MDVEHDDLPPLPQLSTNSSPKRLRRRPPITSASADSPTIVSSSAVVSTPGPDQILTTLIDSLTAISQSARDQLKNDFAYDPSQNEHDFSREERDEYFERPASSGSLYAESAFNPSIIPASELGDDSDNDAAEAPVIGFTRPSTTPSKKKRRPNKLNSSKSFNVMLSDRSVSLRTSFQSLRSQDVANASPDPPFLTKRSSSATSLARSIIGVRSRSPRKASPPAVSRSQSPAQTPTPEAQSPATSTVLESPSPAAEDARPREHAEPSASSPADDSQMSNTLSPLHRENLGEHLIPNRQSSLRTPGRKGHHRHSTGSRDLRDLNIDEDLIGSEDSTVRRIKELQEAREKRHSEWRKEERPERPQKRHSAPSPKALRRSNTYQSSKLSVTEVLVESEHETTPQLSAQIGAADLALMPALTVPAHDNGPLTPIETYENGKPKTTTPGFQIPPVVPVLSSPAPIKDRSKRASMMLPKHDQRAEDIKSIVEEVDAFLNAPRLTQKLRHPRTGRTIAFSEVGDPQGFAVFCCVGMGLTRYVTSFYDELAKSLKLRIITPDRPGVGESESVPDRLSNPLTWVDDVAVICNSLDITRFSLLAHSAGTIYALATALKMPQFVRGRIHLLAPWIPPSQMPQANSESHGAILPMSQRILSVLPAPMLKVANSRFLSATSASVESKSSKNKRNKHLDSLDNEYFQYDDMSVSGFSLNSDMEGPLTLKGISKDSYSLNLNNFAASPSPEPRTSGTISPRPSSPRLTTEARATLYNQQLTHRIWTLATLNANPALDLVTCIERKKTIGFRYADITRSVVIRHGAKDTRVPLENVRWLNSIMKRCELRVLEDEGHSLMASASVMSSVLSEIAKEWDEWQRIARYKEKKKEDATSPSLRSSRRYI
jgi:pimeloyl-ACP methyl ester carboxylesterase